MTAFEKVAQNIGVLAGLKSNIGKILRWDPALASVILGSSLGAAAAGPKRRLRGAMVGGALGFGSGMLGRGILEGASHAGKLRPTLVGLIGKNKLLHQYAGAGVGGTIGGALMQPTPMPVMMSQRGRFEDLKSRALKHLQSLRPEIERV